MSSLLELQKDFLSHSFEVNLLFIQPGHYTVPPRFHQLHLVNVAKMPDSGAAFHTIRLRVECFYELCWNEKHFFGTTCGHNSLCYNDLSGLVCTLAAF